MCPRATLEHVHLVEMLSALEERAPGTVGASLRVDRLTVRLEARVLVLLARSCPLGVDRGESILLLVGAVGDETGLGHFQKCKVGQSNSEIKLEQLQKQRSCAFE